MDRSNLRTNPSVKGQPVGEEMQPYMYKRPDSRNWQFRRPVPLHLQDALGRPFITGSLRTPYYKEAARRARQ
ncbi:DUF6538 domain-containing protein [Burkholderia gladioli]|uniref:DUF6538 domain-containing protein n=1 Tax=Burkholderia gladioli TaxID=28095 RepID=UPI0012D2C55A|nr:DUF6538 domain-containing protein [Burkholderia gladioli]